MMMRTITAAGAALIAVLAFVGTADDARAGCHRCGRFLRLDGRQMLAGGKAGDRGDPAAAG